MKFKIFSRTTWAYFNQNWHKASLGEGDSNISNEGPCPFSKRDKIEQIFKNFKKICVTLAFVKLWYLKYKNYRIFLYNSTKRKFPQNLQSLYFDFFEDDDF